MHKLSNSLYYISKHKNINKEDLGINHSIETILKDIQKDIYIKISTEFNIVGYLNTLKIPIYSFGYGLNIAQLKFSYYGNPYLNILKDIPNDNGSKNKIYLNDKKDRNKIFNLIFKHFKEINNNLNNPIIIRGIINTFKRNNYRYIAIDNNLLDKYEKIVISFSKDEIKYFNNLNKEEKSLKQNLFNYFKYYIIEEEFEIWIYIKKEYIYLKNELNSLIITNVL